jgi:hypothetical protein
LFGLDLGRNPRAGVLVVGTTLRLRPAPATVTRRGCLGTRSSPRSARPVAVRVLDHGQRIRVRGAGDR